MMSGELLVVLAVAIVVFGPEKLPMLAEHVAKAVKKFNQLKNQANQLWQAELARQQLQENQRKAEQADSVYRNLQ
ncbi:twin-arginine translocase TatA/TatE family subunit [Legionella dresdenensis]|uniref:Twin-arginine translocase TatA/TatE family subunit n=1 Tax=Legionella dresdenensis TaxID=450200 RepID=A0ABV8CE52_9GAMM